MAICILVSEEVIQREYQEFRLMIIEARKEVIEIE